MKSFTKIRIWMRLKRVLHGFCGIWHGLNSGKFIFLPKEWNFSFFVHFVEFHKKIFSLKIGLKLRKGLKFSSKFLNYINLHVHTSEIFSFMDRDYTRIKYY